MSTIKLTNRELAAVRAALDLYMCHAYDGFDEQSVLDTASNNGAFEPLSADDTLILRARLTNDIP